MSKLILIISQTHISLNPRVLKESKTLDKAGFSVIILTAIYSEDLLSEDLELIKETKIKYLFYSDLRKSNLKSLFQKTLRKVSIYIQYKFGVESKYSLGYGAWNLFKKCKRFNPDLYIMHQELPMVIGCQLLDNKISNVAFDFEDWYSQDLLSEARKKRPLRMLSNSERIALEKGICSWTTSDALSSGLCSYYSILKKPQVIYNSFQKQNLRLNKADQTTEIPKLIWFSQTIGPGRGLEFLIKTMGKCSRSLELNLRGKIEPEYLISLKQILSSKDKLNILPLIKNCDIQSDLQKYDIGLALEPNYPINKDLTISNKLFHYMASGLPIISSCTKGQLEIASKHPNIFFSYKQDDEQGLINILNQILILNKTTQLYKLRSEVLKIYALNYSWDNEEKELLKMIDNIFRCH